MKCPYCPKKFKPKRLNYPHCDQLKCALKHTKEVEKKRVADEWMTALSSSTFDDRGRGQDV